MIAMEARRRFPFSDRPAEKVKRIVEPELDMNRIRPESSPWMRYLREILHWLFPVVPSAAKAKRSIGRELEEDWPSVER